MRRTRQEAKAIYQQRLQDFNTKQEKLKKAILRVSWSRFLVFLLGGLLAWFLNHFDGNWLIYTLAITLISFLVLVRYHDRLLRKQKFYTQLVRINKEELSYLANRWNNFDPGEEFLKKKSLHTVDLDVFGPDSLFQKINRTSTLSGKNRLAHWFRFPKSHKEHILQRQEAVKELTNELDYRQKFRAIGLSGEEFRGDYVRMIRWMKEKTWVSNSTYLKSLRFFIPVMNFTLSMLAILQILPWSLPGLSLLVTLALLAPLQKQINKRYLLLNRRAKLLLKYVELLRLIEDKDFKTEQLVLLQKDMRQGERKAWENIQQLAKLLQQMDQRLNMIMGILLNVFLMWDIRILFQVEQWKKKHMEDMVIWFNNIGIFDAYNSLANLAFNEAEWIFPEPVDDTLYEAEGLRHPLMKTEECVPNSIAISKKPHFVVITGANMAGKSTWLRTLGSNLMLAMMGAVVPANKMRFQPAKIATSLRTTDSLMKNESYFYSELKRLKEIIELLKEGKAVFVLLDEILKGTNSGDKEAGSIALLKQLISLKAFGIIATHDLNLAKVSEQYRDYILNQRFEAEIIDNKLFFDYQLKNGVAQNFNATFLMKKMGITL